jgi:hypothetical protein
MNFTVAQPEAAAREASSMPDLDFKVERAEAEPFSVAPLLTFKLRIDQTDGATPIHAIALRCQIRIEPGRRRYTDQQRDRLLELFGPPSQWGQSLRPLLWTHTSAIVPAFTGGTVADLPVPCSYDFNIAGTKYCDALGDDGDVPLCLLFSGTVFYQAADGSLQAAPISWNNETDYRLPVRIWREMMDRYYPNSAWLCLGKDVFDRLRQYKLQTGRASWEQAVEDLLNAADAKKVAG